MSGELAVSLVLKLKDQGSSAAEQALKKVSGAIKETGTVAKSVSDAAISAFRKMANAREVLGIRSEKAIQNEIRQTEAAYQRLAASGTLSMREQARAAETARTAIVKLQNEMGILTTRQKMARAADMAPIVAAGGYAALRTIGKPIGRYAELEQAQTDLRISMTNKSGQVSSQYAAILLVAQQLGNKLPGTTRDFVLEAQALKQKGIDDSVISGGGLRAAGYLRVGMGLRNQGEAGELVAKSMHTFGLKDSELEGAADHTFRLYKAFGTKALAIHEANTYMGGTLNQLGWTGAGNMRKVQAMQGMMAMKGIESSVFGTNFADMLSFIARNEVRLKGKGAETREVNEILHKRGIKLNLFDKQGKFAGPDQFIKEMEKFRVLTQKEQVEVFHKLFGTQGERVATALAHGGTKGVAEAEAKVDNIIPLVEAVKQMTETFAGKTEALSGSIDNMLAEMGRPIGEALKPLLDILNNWAGAATNAFKENPMAGAAAAIGGAAASWVAVSGLLKMMLGGAGIPVRVVNGLPGMTPGGPSVPPGAPPGTSTGGGLAGAARFVGSATMALAPLAAMSWATEWAGDTSNDKGRTQGLLSLSDTLKQLLGDPTAGSRARYEAQRAELQGGGPQVIQIQIDGRTVAEVLNRHSDRQGSRN
jgi:TP901 family phage tail tape measure protein